MRNFLGLLAALAAVSALLALSAGQALANHVHCGDVLTQDTTLDSDLLGCSDPALTLTHNNIVLNLNGHTVSNNILSYDQDNAPFPPDPGEFSKTTDVTVTNGTVEGRIGLHVYRSATVTNITSAGIGVIDSTAGLVANNHVEGGQNGITFAFVPSGLARDNVVIGSQHEGIHFAREAGGAAVGNVVLRSLEDGIAGAIRGGGDITITNNVSDGNGDDGIDTEASSATISGNHVWRNGDLGIEALPFTAGGGNWAKHNGNPAQCIPGYLCSTTGKPKK
jgi:hypothetical protein